MAKLPAFCASNFIPPNPILYQNEDRTVTLIDIPASIAYAQGAHGPIYSAEARNTPFPSTEPKTQQARDQVLARQGGFCCDSEYKKIIESALNVIQNIHRGPWALPRLISGQGELGDAPKPEEVIRRVDDALSRLFQSITTARKSFLNIRVEPNLVVHQRVPMSIESGLRGIRMDDGPIADDDDHSSSSAFSEESPPEPESLQKWDGSYYNPYSFSVYLTIPSSHIRESTSLEQTFHIPPHSSFLLSSCKKASEFRNHITWCSQEYFLDKIFDFILLDPPWSNKSVTRRTAYDTSSPDIKKLVNGMDLTRYIPPNGLVGIWVTNKPSIRDIVLGHGGIFENLNVSLIEEWVWIKTTTKGEPVYPLNGVWRKPYEVLLLGRAPQSRLLVAEPLPEDKIVRRVIAGTPDFHSRKPCLKMLIESYLPSEYQALEVFARYLVQGWTAWGDEALKYNWKGYFEPNIAN